MSLESILSHILDEARAQKEKIIHDARLEAEKIIKEAKAEAGVLRKEIFEREKSLFERQMQKAVVNARLEHKKNLLEAKQELIGAAFRRLKSTLKAEKFKKEQVLVDKVREAPENVDFYLDRFRQLHETEVAKILFK